MTVLKLDVEKCTGCGICQLVCSAVKEGVFNPKIACLQIHSKYEKQGVRIIGGVCDLCLKCVEVCPTEAITMKNGALNFDEESCNQCELCIEACPHGIIHTSSAGKLLVCDQCGECLAYCPREAIYKEDVTV